MATADSVVVELLAKTDGYTAAINGAANTSQAGFSKIEKAAGQAEAAVARSTAGMGNAARAAANDIERGTGRAANATRNLGRQVADIGVGLSGGQSPFLILAQQAPQVADALADTGGKAAQVAAFFAGPWGAALLAAGSLLGVLVGKALEAGDSMDDLVEKLQQAAEKTRLTAEAQRIFEASADGAAAAIDKLDEALSRANTTQERALQLDLARAKTLRQVQIAALKVAEANAQVARDEAVRAGGSNTELLLRGPGGGLAQGAYAQQAAKSETELALAKERRVKAEKAVTDAAIPLLDIQAAAASDKATAATTKHERALQKLRDAYIGASAAAKTNDQREAATRQYREGRTRIDTTLAAEQKAIQEANKKPPKGVSAETLAKRAEAASVRDVRNNEAYTNEVEQLNQAIIQASRAQEVDAGKLAEYSRQEVESALAKRLNQIAADESAKKYNAQQAEELRKLARKASEIQTLNINGDEIRKRTDESNAVEATRLRTQGDLLQSELAIADSNAERRTIEKQLLDIKYQQLKLEQDAILKDTTGRYSDAQRQQAQITAKALPALRANDDRQLDRRNEGRFDQYRRQISSVDSLQDSIDGVKIDALEAVTDELTKATTAALGLKGAFGNIVGELIRIGIQRRLIGPLADSLFGKADGSTSGSAGNFLKSIGGLFGRASGGYVGPGQMVNVNEGSGRGPELLRMGPQGGTVIPLGQTKATQGQSRITVLAPQSYDLRGVFLNERTLRDLEVRNQQYANAVAGAYSKQAYEASPTRISQTQTRGG